MWSTRLWLVGILTLVHRLTCKSSCKCFAALNLSGAHARMLGMWSILHREKNSHLGYIHPNTHFFQNQMERNAISWENFLYLFLQTGLLHGLMAKSTAPSTAVATRTAAQTWRFFTEVVRCWNFTICLTWGIIESWVASDWMWKPVSCSCKSAWNASPNGWLVFQLDPMTGALKPWTGPGPTLKVSLRNLKQRCPVSSAEMLVPFGSWISDQPRTWIIDYVTIINPQRNVERWICSMPTCLWIKDFDGRHRAPGSWRWTVKKWFLFHVSFSKHIWLKHMLHESHRLRF